MALACLSLSPLATAIAATAPPSAVSRRAAADLKNVYSNINAEWRAKGNFNLRVGGGREGGAAPKCEIPNFGPADLSVHDDGFCPILPSSLLHSNSSTRRMTANRGGSVCPVPDYRAPPTPVSIRRPLLDVKIHVCFSEAPLFTLLSGFIHISSLHKSLSPNPPF